MPAAEVCVFDTAMYVFITGRSLQIAADVAGREPAASHVYRGNQTLAIFPSFIS